MIFAMTFLMSPDLPRSSRVRDIELRSNQGTPAIPSLVGTPTRGSHLGSANVLRPIDLGCHHWGVVGVPLVGELARTGTSSIDVSLCGGRDKEFERIMRQMRESGVLREKE